MYVVKQDLGNSYNQASLKNWILNSGSQSLTACWNPWGSLKKKKKKKTPDACAGPSLPPQVLI